MNTKLFAGLLIVGSLTFLGIVTLVRPEVQKPTVHMNQAGVQHKLTVYQSPTCGCCPNWVTYMRIKGYEVDVIKTEDMERIKEQYHIPQNLSSCHTTIVNDGEYFIEGHMPEEAVSEMLENEPDIYGITLPGMPAASPGMPGDKVGPFEIMQIDKELQTKEYMRL